MFLFKISKVYKICDLHIKSDRETFLIASLVTEYFMYLMRRQMALQIKLNYHFLPHEELSN